MKILFITDSFPNYVPDLLLHGLRKLLGEQVVDYPRKECLYEGVKEGIHTEMYYETFWFPADNGDIDREDIESKLQNKYFDYLICDVRSISFINDLYVRLPDIQTRLVIIDGEDLPITLDPGPFLICRRETDGTDYSIPLPMSLPEEIFHRIASYDGNPKSYSVGFLGSVGKQKESRFALIEKIASYYPDSLLNTNNEDTHHGERVGLDSYYDNLQRCRVVLNLCGAGCDTFRFWENAACNALHVSEQLPLFIPDDFKDRRDIMRFSDVDQLRSIIDTHLSGSKETDQIIQNSRQHLWDYHLTTKRATYFLDRIKNGFYK